MFSLPVHQQALGQQKPSAASARRLIGALTLSALALGSTSAQAALVSDFTSDYAPASWTGSSGISTGGAYLFSESNNPNPPVNTLSLWGNNAITNPGSYYTVTLGSNIPANGTFSFSYDLIINGDANASGGYYLNGTQYPLQSYADGSGSTSFSVTVGQSFYFYVFSDVFDALGASRPQFTITGFTGPGLETTPIPEPASLLLFAAGAMGFSMSRNRGKRLEKA